ncbi:MAG: 3-phosphoshikimate 1-carboxyvinyltransferase [Acetatifactor sp.]|nr:3-phosphoshikimate 1-carboxyvinyltransferase [Acetatifactor sp.]
MEKIFIQENSAGCYFADFDTSNVKVSDNPVCVTVPGSKSITNRSLLIAALARGQSKLTGVQFSEDSECFLECLTDLKYPISVNKEEKTVTISGLGGYLPCSHASLNVKSAGTAARFITAYLGLSDGSFDINASDQMKKRPMAPLIDCLRDLGAEIVCTGEEGFFPLTVKGHGFGKNEITVDIDKSSQFLSAILISSVLAHDDITVNVTGNHGLKYVEMTCRMMQDFKATIKKEGDSYKIPFNSKYMARNYTIEPDASAAGYFYALSPILGIPVLVKGIFENSLQGDVAITDVLCEMGCSKEETHDGIVVYPPKDGCLHGVDVDMSAFSDQALTVAVIASLADTPTTIRGIGHIRMQESDRIHGMVTELSKCNIECEEGEDYVVIHPGSLKGATIETYDDHRMAMAFSLLSVKNKDISISNPMCCKKTFAEYFETLDKALCDASSDR